MKLIDLVDIVGLICTGVLANVLVRCILSAMQTEPTAATIMSAAERVAWAVQQVAQGLIDGRWSIRKGCEAMKIHPQTYYKHRKLQNAGCKTNGGGLVAAVAPLHTSPNQKAPHSQDSTNEEPE